MEIVLPVAVPESVKAGSECNWSFDAFTFGYHHDVRVPHLDGQLGLMLHLSEKMGQAVSATLILTPSFPRRQHCLSSTLQVCWS